MWPDDVDAAAQMYDDVINKLLDDMLPFVSSTRRQRPSDPWFDSECRSAKRLTRRLQRAAHSAHRLSAEAAVVAKEAWMAQRRSYRKLRHQKCASFWSAEFAYADNPRRVWSTVDRLMAVDVTLVISGC